MLLKRTIPVMIAFITGAWFAIQFFIPSAMSAQTERWASNWYKILAGFAAILGLYSLCHLHWSRMRRRVPGWGYSVLVYFGLALTVFMGLIGEVHKGVALLTKQPDALRQVAEIQSYESAYLYSSGYNWVFDYIYTPSSATMFSLLAFFIASAAYRTFRARSWQAAVLLIAAVIVMFGQVPIAAVISQWIPDAADWLMMYPNMAAKRGIMLGVSLGVVATALRIIFGIERAYLGGD